MSVVVEFTCRAAEALGATAAFLHADPVRHNVICTLLDERVAYDEAIRFWWARADGEVLGAVFQGPAEFPALLSRVDSIAVEPLARAMAAVDDPPVSGVNGTAPDAASLAGAFATITRRPASPVEGQRIYELEELVVPQVDGVPRLVNAADVDLLVDWTAGFAADTGSPVGPDLRGRAERLVGARAAWLWEVDGEPVSTALRSTSAAGVSRVGFVYTPAAHRGHGFAAAITAHVSRQVLDDGDRCILYTQLDNPTSNALYQRLGYRPVHECIRYSFD